MRSVSHHFSSRLLTLSRPSATNRPRPLLAFAQGQCFQPIVSNGVAARATSSSSSAPAPKASFDKWSPAEVKELLQQIAEVGRLKASLLQHLRGQASQDSDLAGDGETTVAVASTDGTEEHEPEEEEEETCYLEDFLLTAELCSATRFRDFVLLSQLGDKLAAEVASAGSEVLMRVSTSFSSLGVLHPPLFTALAKALLQVLPSSHHGSEDSLGLSGQLVRLARAFAAQRHRHEELFGRIAQTLRLSGLKDLSSEEALSLLHSHAFLRLAGPHLQDGELGKLWGQLQDHVLAPGADALGPEPLTELCYVLFLARRVDQETGLPLVCCMLEQATPALLRIPAASWTTKPALHQRLLLLRSALRYLHREAYASLPVDTQQLLRRVHRMESPPRDLRPIVAFTRKLSTVLRKLKIGHIVNAERGPFVLDVVERDRKLVYECNHFDRFYVNSIEKIASLCLQERILKAMGYKVIQVPHWQWNRIKHRRQRMEYIRMSRYYAVKDARELAPRDEQPQDVAVNDFDFLGEYFFRKDLPRSSWSWFQPRYDASKRLAQPSGQL